jgi:hypothetical protein
MQLAGQEGSGTSMFVDASGRGKKKPRIGIELGLLLIFQNFAIC